MIEGLRTLVGIYFVSPNVGHLSPSGEKVWQLVDHQRQLPCGRQVAVSPPVSTSPSLVSLCLALGASVPSFRQLSRPPLSLSLFPDLSTCLSALCPPCPLLFLSCPSERVAVRQLQRPQLLSVTRPAPSGRQWLTLTGDGRGRGSPHTVQTGPWALPDGGC